MSQERQSSQTYDEQQSLGAREENSVLEFADGSEQRREVVVDNLNSGGYGKRLSFEEGIERLERIVEALEERDVSLEKALSLFKEGVGLVQHCNALLDKAERVMQVLLTEDGEVPGSDTFAREG